MAFHRNGASNFQRSQSKVWWGQQPERDEYGFVALPSRTPQPPPPPSAQQAPKPSSKLTPPEIATTSWSYRRGSPGSFKSHDSGFSDSDQSPPNAAGDRLNASVASTTTAGQRPHPIASALSANSSPTTPQRRTLTLPLRFGSASRSVASVSGSSSSDERSTPPTVIRKKPVENANELSRNLCRRISFSAPNSPIYERIDADLLSQIDSIQYANTSPLAATASTCASVAVPAKDCTWESSFEEADEDNAADPEAGGGSQDATRQARRPQRKFNSLKRGKAVRRQGSRAERTLLRCVSQISIESADDFYMQAERFAVPATGAQCTDLDEPSDMMQTAIPHSPAARSAVDANQTVTFGTTLHDDESRTDGTVDTSAHIRHILPTYAELYPTQTSTPKAQSATKSSNRSSSRPTAVANIISNATLVELEPTAEWDDCTYREYSNPLLNGHPSSIQAWLDTTRGQYCHEVLATLQTKSIAAQAARYADLNSAMAGRLVEQLQQRAHRLHADFEYVERLLLDARADEALLKELPGLVRALHANVLQTTQKCAVHNVFGARAEAAAELLRFRNNCAAISDMSYELIATADRIDLEAIDAAGVLEDVRLLRRYVLVTMRMVLERLVRVIVDRCEQAAGASEPNSELVVATNLQLLAQLSNAAYAGLASLNEALVATRATRVLLGIVADAPQSAVRVLGLRALTTICCSPEAIHQFGRCGGLDVLAEILCEPTATAAETAEALSVLAQLTAEWHGPQHRLGEAVLRPLVEQLVARLTQLAELRADCGQTLLLAAACLCNLARLETSAAYALMSNETVVRLRNCVAGGGGGGQRADGMSVFLCEQVVNMLAHMVGNRRCHRHLTQREILAFLTEMYHAQTAAAQRYGTAAEREAAARVTRAVLDVFSRLLRQSAANKDVMEHSVALLFVRMHERVRADASLLSGASRRLVAEISEMLEAQVGGSEGWAIGAGGADESGSVSVQLLESYV